MQQKRRWIGIFDRSAATYDHVGPALFSHFGQKLVEIADIPDGAQVLDVATGKGAVLFPAADAVGDNGNILGIDLSAQMVRATAQEIARRGLQNCDTRQMDAEHLDMPDETYDFVLCGFAVFFFPHIDETLAEFRRVLKPNGRLVFSTFDAQHIQNWEWFYAAAQKYLPPAPAAEASPVPVFSTAAGLKDLLGAAGFAQAEVFEETAAFIYASDHEFWSFIWSQGMRGTLEAIENTSGTMALKAFQGEVNEWFHSKKAEDGLHLSIPALISSAIKPHALPDL